MIHITSARMKLFGCPAIWIGKTEAGHIVYCRYRWGHLSVRYSTEPNPDHDGAGGASIAEVNHGDPFDGFLNYYELRTITKGLIEWPSEFES
ncbi:MAG: hypothetical protein ABIT37_20125 [Luteolibacter sp.]